MGLPEPEVRKLPVYLLLDCSDSMTGESIEGVKQAIRALTLELWQDPQMQEATWLSVLAYSSNAGQIMPLTPLKDFVAPKLKTGGTGALGAALTLLCRCLQDDLLLPDAHQNGDWAPLVFLFTDGVGTDDWQAGLAQLQHQGKAKLIVCGAGAQAELSAFADFAEGLLLLNTLSAGDFSEFFSWTPLT